MILETTVIVSIVGWAASPVVSKLVDKLQWYAVQRYTWHQGLPEKLETLAHFLDEIGSTVNVVGAQGFRDPKMMGWLCQLRGAADEVDHIFDVLDYEIIGSSSSSQAAAAERGGAASIGSADLCARLKKLLAKLNDIRQSSRGLVQASMLAVAGASPDGDGRSRPVTGPLLPQGLIPLGYDAQYEYLRTWLLQPPQGRGGVPVLAIVGHGGMGKTTLAQRAWGDEEVKRTFNLVIWAWVYNKTSEADLLGEIWRSAAAAAGRQHEQMSFGGMQLALQELVRSKRYLLVLDDVCNDEAATERQRRDVWSAVLAPFQQPRDIGSRVLVTTRAVICADTLGADSSSRLALDGIGYGSFVSLLRDTSTTAAFGTGSVEEATRARELQQFLRSRFFSVPEASSAPASRRLAPNWRCSPLSTKEMGLELRDSRGKTKWEEIIATDSHRNAVSVHETSFRHLPPHLQHCCAFISLFPNKFRFLPEMLVKMWIADGFISGDDGSSCASMEETARGYLDDLLARSLLQPVQDGGKTYYMVHEEIHSMVRSVSAGYFRMMQPNCAAAKIPHTVRHLSVTTGCVARLKKLSLLKRMRTFIVLRDPSAAVTAIDEDLLKELEGVRVLDFTGTDIKNVPPEIGKLIHLRCLALPQTVRTFPEEFSKLFHLQTLIRSTNKYDQTDEDTSRVPTPLPRLGCRPKRRHCHRRSGRRKMSGGTEGGEVAGSRPSPSGSQVLEPPSSRAAVEYACGSGVGGGNGAPWVPHAGTNQFAPARFDWISNQSSTLAWSCGAAMTPAADPGQSPLPPRAAARCRSTKSREDCLTPQLPPG
ncbi:putative disease resistance protein RGA4 [Panicum virgatum]|uniref:NB-ARC domain-containing protein n=1 Tax=Panicum virgatum TaxID=38727 RepID=A0A8T0SRL5_PANVG|nr:putative disease resistance protein RGA4 [Panicum virgatum]KAG2601241.1 hypothetical protein PVAP13_5KG575400 [Panicum virgatum]